MATDGEAQGEGIRQISSSDGILSKLKSLALESFPEGVDEVPALFLIQFWLLGWPWLLLYLLVLLFLASVPFWIIGYAILNNRRIVRTIGEYAAELGKVVYVQLNLRMGQGWVIRPMDAQLERIEVSAVPSWRWRMLVDLVQGSDLGFEMWRKPMPPFGGRVFAPGDAMIGVEDLDRRFWVETAMPKRVVVLLSDPEVQQLLAVAEERRLRYLRVGGSRIELQCDRGAVDSVRAMFGLAQALSHRMFELG